MGKTKLTKNTFKPKGFEFIDLGLPSGKAWATTSAPGYYTFDEAVEAFGDYLPKGATLVELYEECDWKWDNEKRGYTVTGPNGNSIFMPANGYIAPGEKSAEWVGFEGNYWSRLPYSQTSARYLFFSSGGVYPLISYYRAGGFGVWPVRE